MANRTGGGENLGPETKVFLSCSVHSYRNAIDSGQMSEGGLSGLFKYQMQHLPRRASQVRHN